MSKTEMELPAEIGSTELTRFNALRHGVLSQYTVLPWEDEGEYEVLLAALVAEHWPKGPTEEHLVEELAGVLWRKRRLRLAEGAAHRRGLDSALSSYRETGKVALVHVQASEQEESVATAIRSTAAGTEDDVRDLEQDEAMTRNALKLLGSRRKDAYRSAMSALREDTREWWQDMLDREPEDLCEGEEPTTADVEGLRHFLESEVMPWFEKRKSELGNRPLLRAQAFGEALDPDKMERLVRYEVHLDRKLERILSMLIRLRDIRAEAAGQ